MADPFEEYNPGLDSPAGNAFAVTPHDSNELSSVTRAIYVGGAGDIAITTANDDEVTFVGLLAGSILPVRAKIIKATSTTATDIVGLY